MTERNWIEKESTLPETNIAPENRPSQKETIVFQPSIFRGYVMLVSGRVPVSLHPPFSIHFHPASTVAACRPMAAQIEVQKAMLGGPTTSQATKKRCNSDCQPVTHPLRHERSRFTMADCPIQLQKMKDAAKSKQCVLKMLCRICIHFQPMQIHWQMLYNERSLYIIYIKHVLHLVFLMVIVMQSCNSSSIDLDSTFCMTNTYTYNHHTHTFWYVLLFGCETCLDSKV